MSLKHWSFYAVLCLVAAPAADVLAARNRAPKLEFGSDFARATYEDNTCASAGQFIYPATDLAFGKLLDNWPQRLDETIHTCDAPWATQEPLAIVADEVLLGKFQSPDFFFWVSLASEPCVAEPTIVLRGAVDPIYFDKNSEVPLMMRLIGAGLAKHCGSAPKSLQVRVRDRAIQPDPAKPATRKEPAGNMLVRTESYAGRYIAAAAGEREGSWQDKDPAARDAFLVRLGERTRYDPVARQEARRADLALYEMEHREEIEAAIRELLGGAANMSVRQGCSDALYGTSPTRPTLTPEYLDYCEKLLRE